MELRWINQTQAQARSVALGTFDGVHLGHQKLLEQAVQNKPKGGTSAVFTFDVPPAHYFRRELRLLSSFERKVELIRLFGIDEVAWFPFGPEIASLDAHQFVQEILLKELRAKHVVCGFNYRFGKGAAGDAQFLQEQGEIYGFQVTVVPSIQGPGGQVISSTLIRQLLAEGRLEQASNYLGYYPAYSGVVVQGEGRGRQLGFPTANLRIDPNHALPGEGVYLTWCVLPEGQAVPAVTSIGRNPTFDGQMQTVEAYILDFAADLYGQELKIHFLQRMRDMIRYNSAEALQEQIRADVSAARQLLTQFHLQDPRVVLK